MTTQESVNGAEFDVYRLGESPEVPLAEEKSWYEETVIVDEPKVRLMGEVTVGDISMPYASMPLLVFALLALNAGKPVRKASIITECWGDTPVKSSSTTVETYIYKLRGFFRQNIPEVTIDTIGAAYRLPVDPRQVDFLLLGDLLGQVKRLRNGGACREASSVLHRATGLIRGELLPQVEWGLSLIWVTEHFKRHVRTARLFRAMLANDLGEHEDVLDDLLKWKELYPFDERFAREVMIALYRSGCAGEAVEVYRCTRQALFELGMTPTPVLENTYVALLKHDLDSIAPRFAT